MITSNGERLTVQNIVRNSSLWSDVVFKKKKILFHQFDFETSDLEFEVSKSSIWKHTTLCDKGVFSFINISQLRLPIELKFSQVCYFMYMLRYPTVKTSLWQLPIVSSVFYACMVAKLYLMWKAFGNTVHLWWQIWYIFLSIKIWIWVAILTIMFPGLCFPSIACSFEDITAPGFRQYLKNATTYWTKVIFMVHI